MRFQLSDLPPKFRDQVAAQLAATPHPKTISVERVPDLPVAKKRVRQKFTPDASMWFVAAGIPKPETEWRFAADRRWRFDYAWISEKVALEVEGGVWTQGRHTRGAGFLGDMEKYNCATLLGWRVLRVTPEQLRTNATLNLLRDVLGV